MGKGGAAGRASARDVFVRGNFLQPSDQLKPADQKGFPGLKAAAAVEQADGGAAVEAEDFFDDGAVDDRGGEGAQLVQNGGKSLSPFRFAGQQTSQSESATFRHSCAKTKNPAETK